MASPQSSSSLTLERGLRVLRVLSEHPEGMTVSELAGALGTHRAGIYRLLGPHLSQRLVWRRDDRYYLGAGLIELASRVRPRLQEVAGPLLQSLADDVAATAALTVRDGEDAAVVLDVRSPRQADLHITYRPGLRHPVSIAASGIAILAGAPARDSERAEVAEARERGWAKSTGELLPGASGVAAPLRAVATGGASAGAAADVGVGASAGAGDADAAVSAVWIGDRDDAAMARAVMETARALAAAL